MGSTFNTKLTALQTLNIATISVSIACSFAGAGRLLRDPFWTVDKMIYHNHITFASQLLDVYSIWVVNLSICVYLLALNFPKQYRRVTWGTAALETLFGVALPTIQHFSLCQPLVAKQDIWIAHKMCWNPIRRTYLQPNSNIATELIYATAPIAYLHSVQLNRRTQWSVRIVFLMSLVQVVYPTTTISRANLVRAVSRFHRSSVLSSGNSTKQRKWSVLRICINISLEHH